MSISLSVVISTYNREELLRQCLQSLTEQTLDTGLYEVVVIDNNSPPGTAEMVRSFADRYDNFRLVTEPKQGVSHARNRGVLEARGEFVAYLDDDAKATPQWCERVLAAFRTVSPSPVAVGGMIRPFYETPPPGWFDEGFELRSWGDSACFLEPPRAQYGFSGANMAFRKEILLEFQGFSPEFGPVGDAMVMGEETDLFRRMYQRYPCFWYDPQILVLHWAPARNMTVRYRLQRNFKCGQSIAEMEQRPVLSIRYLVSWLETARFLVSIPFALLLGEKPVMTEAVRKGEELAGRIGYLLGRAGSITGR